MTTTEHKMSTANASHHQGRPSIWTAVRDSYRDRRSVKALHSRVEQELSTYTSPADIQELEAMLERSALDNDSVYTQMIERIRLRAA